MSFGPRRESSLSAPHGDAHLPQLVVPQLFASAPKHAVSTACQPQAQGPWVSRRSVVSVLYPCRRRKSLLALSYDGDLKNQSEFFTIIFLLSPLIVSGARHIVTLAKARNNSLGTQ